MLDSIAALGGTMVGRIVAAIIIFIVGTLIIRAIVKLVDKSKALQKTEGTVRTFVRSFIKIALYCLLVIAIVGTLGVEMSSIAAVIASAGVTVGLALQGALSNLAGGIMIMIFKPFKMGDYVEAAGVSGSVTEVSLFYTVLLTPDNKRVTVPNGSLMNANVTDYSSEETRRVDITALVARSEKVGHVQDVLLNAASATPLVINEPGKEPFARISGGSNEALEYTIRVWCKSGDYWTVYFDLQQRVAEACGEAGIAAPAVRVVGDK